MARLDVGVDAKAVAMEGVTEPEGGERLWKGGGSPTEACGL